MLVSETDNATDKHTFNQGAAPRMIMTEKGMAGEGAVILEEVVRSGSSEEGLVNRASREKKEPNVLRFEGGDF